MNKIRKSDIITTFVVLAILAIATIGVAIFVDFYVSAADNEHEHSMSWTRGTTNCYGECTGCDYTENHITTPEWRVVGSVGSRLTCQYACTKGCNVVLGQHDPSFSNGVCTVSNCSNVCPECNGTVYEGSCSLCGLNACDHNFSWTMTGSASSRLTCTGTCSKCGYSKTHTSVLSWTITGSASSRLTCSGKCSVCGYSITHTTAFENGVCKECLTSCPTCKGNGPTSGTCGTCGMEASSSSGACPSGGDHVASNTYLKQRHGFLCTKCNTVIEEGHTPDWSNKDGKCAVSGCDILCPTCDGKGPTSGTCETCGLAASSASGDCSAGGNHVYSTTYSEYTNSSQEKRHGYLCTKCAKVASNSHDPDYKDGKCAVSGCNILCPTCKGNAPASGSCGTCGLKASSSSGECPGGGNHNYAPSYSEYTTTLGLIRHGYKCSKCSQYSQTGLHDPTWENGKCSICGIICSVCNGNGPTSGTCGKCGKTASTSTGDCPSGGNHDYPEEYSIYEAPSGVVHQKKCTKCGSSVTGAHRPDWSNKDGKCAVSGCGILCPTCDGNGPTSGTCETCGMEASSSSGECSEGGNHKWADEFGVYTEVDTKNKIHGRICEKCRKYVTEKHSFKQNITKTGICGYLGETIDCKLPCEECNGNGPASGTCGTCGLTASSSSECKHPSYIWGGNSTYHWKICQEKDCGEEFDSGTHNFDDGECTVCGKECECDETEKDYDSTYHWEICSVCGKILSSKTRHNLNYQTLGQTNHRYGCTGCNYQGATEGHSWNSSTGICSDCNQQCAHSGQTGTTCTNCGMTLNSSHTHNYVCSGTGSSHVANCSGCTVVLTVNDLEEIVPAETASCTTPGKTSYTRCKLCKTVITPGAVIPALGHTITKATDNGNGTHTGKCTTCGNSASEEHEEVVDSKIDATCTNPGKTQGSHCRECDAIIIKQEDIPATGHNIASYEDNEDGTHTGNCTDCGASKTEECSFGTDNVCTKCGAIKNTDCDHEYKIDKEGATQTQHWEKCKKCGNKRNIESHSFVNGECSVCDYQCEHTNTTDQNNETHHWKECDDCGAILDKEAHKYEDGSCNCGATEKKCTHPNTTNKKDETHHWKECNDCGAVLEQEKHIYSNGVCECGEKGNANTSDMEIPNTGMRTTLIIIGISGMVLIGSVIGIKKYKCV